MPTSLTSAISPETIRQHGLTLDEFEKIKQLLGGREPTMTELGIFSVMWSEHCSYKSSRVHLKRLPTRSKLVLQGPGENAGIIDIGDGWACAFKIESHNHPSFIEPFQGATTGGGGILRDIFTVGARTGRDGIHGATMASEEFSEASEAKRPNVQVGDPFLEKLLLEACLEAMQTGAIIGIQDMGAAGLTCSTCEMGGRGGVGIEIELDRVPQRETGMSPYEIMLSESQERMLLVAQKGREQEVLRVFGKWGLDAVEGGRVTLDGKMRVLERGKVVAETPNEALPEDAPVYTRPLARG